MSDQLMVTIPGVGPRLRQLREMRGLSLQACADLIGGGVDKSTISLWETEKRRLTIGMLDKIALALGHRPELVLLHCLKARYPSLRRSDLGKQLDKLARDIVQWEKEQSHRKG
jgi:transcriptional regulator with XRE-family HTH domain